MQGARAVGTGALHQRGDDKGGEVNRVKGYLKDKCQQAPWVMWG